MKRTEYKLSAEERKKKGAPARAGADTFERFYLPSEMIINSPTVPVCVCVGCMSVVVCVCTYVYVYVYLYVCIRVCVCVFFVYLCMFIITHAHI